MKITIFAEADLGDIADEIVNKCSYDDLINFVKSIDLLVADWDFSERLIKLGKELEETLKEENENEERKQNGRTSES